jgi:prefoldin subunit 5
MAERESMLGKREEFLRQQNLQDDGTGATSKAEKLKDEIGSLENKIMSLQQVRQELMNK